MGIVTIGIPQEITIELAKASGAVAFIETGTYNGGTTKWASNYFDSVYTVERAENLYDKYNQELSEIKGITPYLGDSRAVLPEILNKVGDQASVFWLDGHWSGGETAGEEDECPLLGELACLANRFDDMILIDDARLFLSVPPSPHDPSQWPSLPDIIAALPESGKRHFVQVIDDVIFIVPKVDVIKNCLVAYAQKRANVLWEEFVKTQGCSRTLGHRLKKALKKI